MRNEKLSMIITLGVVVVVLLGILFFSLVNKKIVCQVSSDQSKSGYTIDSKYIIKASGKYVKKVNITEIITSKDKGLLKSFKEQWERQYKYNNNYYGGYNYDISIKKNKVISNVVIDYRMVDMKKFIEVNGTMKKYTKNNKLTVDGVRKLYKSQGATCR